MKEEISKYVGSRIRHYRKINKWTQKDLGNRIGVRHNTVSSYENGTNEVEQDVLFKLANMFQISINDFFPSTQTSFIAENKNNYETKDGNVYTFYPMPVSAGTPSTIESTESQELNIPDSVMGRYAGNKEVFLLKINGDSMNKLIPDGSMIAVKKIEISELQNDDIVVFSNSHEYSVKRYYNDTINQRHVFRSESTDKSFIDYVVDYDNADDLTIHGKVVMYIVNLD